MKLQRAILVLLALLGFATFICSYVGLANVKSAEALVRYDLSQKGVSQVSLDDASRRVRWLEQSWTPTWWLGGLTSLLSLLALGLTFHPKQKTGPNKAAAGKGATASVVDGGGPERALPEQHR